MRKILSVVLAVVMLAALATVFPVSAAEAAAPALVITEVVPDSTGLSGNGSDTTDCFEYIEIYNAGSTAVNLYDYSLAFGAAKVKGDQAGQKIERINPIQQKGTSVYNTAGTISTANYPENNFGYYPTNPETAILEPGKTAVIWMFLADGLAEANARGAAATIEDFKNYYGMNNYSAAALGDILVVAVDANGSAPTAVAADAYIATGKATGPFANGGVNSKDVDANSISARFNLYNSSYKAYGIISNAVLDAGLKANKNDVTALKFSSCISYVYPNYDKADAKVNLMYKITKEGGQERTGSMADTSYNFIYTNKKVDLCYDGTGKAAGMIKYGGWDTVTYVTPGLLLPSQVANFTVGNEAVYDLSVGSFTAPSANVAYVRNIKTLASYTSRVSFTAYEQNFYGMADSADSDAIFAALGWAKSLYLNNGGSAKLSIVDGKLVVDNLDIDGNNDGIIDATNTADLDSADSVISIDNIAEINNDDYTVQFEITYLDAQENLRYAGIVFNFNDICSYDTMHIRVNGTANNQRRIGGSTYMTYDSKTALNYAANSDVSADLSSLLNKITNGAEKIYSTESTDISKMTAEQKAQYAPMIGRTVNVKIEVNQVSGPKIYVNDILVSEAATNAGGVALCPIWGVQTNTNMSSIGLFVSQRVKVAIDNIKVTGFNEAYSEAVLVSQNLPKLVEPATGDATIYVAVAMAVSFISLAALVVVKRRKNEN